MADPKNEKDDGEEAWITVQMLPPGPGGEFEGFYAAFIVEVDGAELVITRPVAWYALQHLAYEEDGHEEVDSRIVPVVLEATGEALYLDAGRGGGPDHGFCGVANTADKAVKIGQVVLAELKKAREAQP